MNDLHLKPSDAMDRCKWREVISGTWHDGSSDVMIRAEQELYISGAGSPRFVVFCVGTLSCSCNVVRILQQQ